MPSYTYKNDHRPGSDQLEALYRAVDWRAYITEDQRPLLGKMLTNTDYVLTAWNENELVGLLRAFSDDTSILYIQDLLVHPQHQRQGVGRELMTRCLARYSHVRSKVLLTGSDEHPQKLYAALGFRNIKTLKVNELNAFVMVKGVDLH